MLEEFAQRIEAAERERCAEVFNMARICAENNMKRADDCGALARKLLDALNSLEPNANLTGGPADD